MTDPNNEKRGIIFMLVAVFFFALMDIFMKLLSEVYPSFQVAFLRGAASLPFLLGWLFFTKGFRRLKTGCLHLHVIRGVISIGFLASVIYAFSVLPLVTAYTLFFTSPLIIAIFSIIFFKEKVGWHRWLAIIAGLSGVLIAFPLSQEGLFSLGAIACLIGVLGYSTTVMMIKHISKTDTTEAQVFYFILFVTISGFFIALPNWKSMDLAEHWWMILGLGFTGTLGQHFITEAFRSASASLIAPLEYSAMVWALIFGYLIWSDIPGVRMMSGAGVIIAGGLYLIYRESVNRKKAKLLEIESETQ